MALTNYCDYMLFRKAETLWEIFPLKVPPTQPHITPTLTYSQYHDTLVNVYNTGLTENEIVVADYRTKCLADFVTGVTAGGVHVTGATIDCYTDIATYTNSSGGTFTLDLSCVGDLGGFWSASSVDGTFIVNSGTTDAGANPNKVGIGTLIPSHELAVSGTASASTSLLSPIISAQTGIIAGNLGVSGETHVAGDLNLGLVDSNIALINRIANTGTNVLGGSVVYNAGLGTGTGPPGSHIWYGGDKSSVSGSIQHSNIGLMLLNTFGMSDDVTTLRLYSVASTSDSFEIGVNAAGLTTLSTTDSGGATADLILSPDGQVRVDVGLVVTGNTVMNGTLSATTSCKVGNGDGFISAATIDGPTISADTLYIKNKTVTSAADIGILVGIATDDKVYTATTATLGVGVSSVTPALPSTSTGDILSISPTTGGVVIEPHVYGGGSNIGAVPQGGTGGQYLDGNLGVWTTLPAGGGDSFWSASSVDGTFIVNSGTSANGANPNKVGIGTLTPNHDLSVSGTVSADTSFFVGSDCIFKSPGFGNVYIGEKAGLSHTAGQIDNTAVGYLSMGFATMTTDAINNTAFGFASLSNLTSGSNNTAVGVQANASTDTGYGNVSLGHTAMFSSTYHSYNVGIGYEALRYVTSGAFGKTVPTNSLNIAIGYRSQYSSFDGAYNTSLGSNAMEGTLTMAGTGNTAIGKSALNLIQTGSYNIAIGYQAGDNVTTGDYNISIGSDAQPVSVTADYQMNIGDIIFGNDEYTDSAISQIGIGYNDPKVKLDVHHNPTDLVDNTGGGEVITFGVEHGSDTLSAGKLMRLNTSGVWRYADADGSSGNDELLAIALGDTVAKGLLIRGFFDQVAELTSGVFTKGLACYVSNTAGQITFTQPNTSGDYVRVVGYGTDTANVIYFNPDGTYITVA